MEIPLSLFVVGVIAGGRLVQWLPITNNPEQSLTIRQSSVTVNTVCNALIVERYHYKHLMSTMN